MTVPAGQARVREILSAIAEGQRRMTDEEALLLFEHAQLPELSVAATTMRRRLNPQPIVSYIVDRNVNYTNICLADCDFCAFYRKINDPEGYILSFEELGAKIAETQELGGNQILLQGGMHPKLKLEWYEEMLRFVKSEYGIHLHAFSAPEIHAFSRINRMSYERKSCPTASGGKSPEENVLRRNGSKCTASGTGWGGARRRP